MLPVSVQIVVGLVAGYLAATISESVLHHYIGHATSSARRRWAANPRLYGYLLRAHFRHAIVHHGLTFRRNHVTQFDDGTHQSAVDARASLAGDAGIHNIDYGLRAGWIGFATYNLTTIPALGIVALIAGPWSAVSAAPWLAVTPALSRWFHPYLHRSYECGIRESPCFVAWLLRTSYSRAVARHHYLHHKYPNSNFNLLLGGDWLLRVHRGATPTDIEEMKNIGLRVD